MPKFSIKSSLVDFQQLISDIYSLPDDRLYSISDLLSNQERFTMRALKGIRKNDNAKLTLNLIIAFSWLMAVANRLHIDIAKAVWKRFPYLCSYCGKPTCVCKKFKSTVRQKLPKTSGKSPDTIAEYQKMFETIYPAKTRTLYISGVHLAEEMGELSEAIHNFLGEHTKKRFAEVELELADFVSCVFGVANSAQVNMAQRLAKNYINNCHACHHAPCTCNFHTVAEFVS